MTSRRKTANGETATLGRASCPIFVRDLGVTDYAPIYERMREFTRLRDAGTPDEFWALEHNPVYTQGYSCAALPAGAGDIPVMATDRGGQITYHGPGQLIIYLLMDLKRRRAGVRGFVRAVESATLAALRSFGIEGTTAKGAPGIYVDGRKVASLGFRVTRGCAYHGLSVNVDMDIEPFQRIDPCGIQGLEVTSMRLLGVTASFEDVKARCADALAEKFCYDGVQFLSGLPSLPASPAKRSSASSAASRSGEPMSRQTPP